MGHIFNPFFEILDGSLNE